MDGGSVEEINKALPAENEAFTSSDDEERRRLTPTAVLAPTPDASAPDPLLSASVPQESQDFRFYFVVKRREQYARAMYFFLLPDTQSTPVLAAVGIDTNGTSHWRYWSPESFKLGSLVEVRQRPEVLDWLGSFGAKTLISQPSHLSIEDQITPARLLMPPAARHVDVRLYDGHYMLKSGDRETKGKHLHKFIYIYVTRAGAEPELAALGEAKNNTCYQYSSLGAFKGPPLETCTTRAKVSAWLEAMGASREAMPPAVMGADGPGVSIRIRKYSGHFIVDQGVQRGGRQRMCRFWFLQGNDGVMEMAALGVEDKPQQSIVPSTFRYWRKTKIPSSVLEPCASKDNIVDFLQSMGAKKQLRPPNSAKNLLPDVLELEFEDPNKPIVIVMSLRSLTNPRDTPKAPVLMDLACQGCGSLEGDGVMLTCDDCNEGWHMQCLPSKMRSAPDSSWYCPFCAAVRADEDVVQLPRPTSGTDIPCRHCGDSNDDIADMLFCEDCSVGYHLTCLPVPLLEPPPSSWYCPLCSARRATVMISKRKVQPRAHHPPRMMRNSGEVGTSAAASEHAAAPSSRGASLRSLVTDAPTGVVPRVPPSIFSSSFGYASTAAEAEAEEEPGSASRRRKRMDEPPRRMTRPSPMKEDEEAHLQRMEYAREAREAYYGAPRARMGSISSSIAEA
eukprot:CAMPEP_0177787216 /NCGR_PEP_ID=MMETSP0491_2-20121128/21353_1 /TAXON_ID=63592 /ORGANISM="Tetraselmis chuii, Strain PLY429" /LENGTH=673 /DNA_ID=CAMNT_0019308509 /DNA_START=317 /DNA_END=2334 /DNA_ORIENTATION=-